MNYDQIISIVILLYTTSTRASPQSFPAGFPTGPPPRPAQGIPGTDSICVPEGTCTSNDPGGIDPRIVTPGETSCPSGQALCRGVTGGEQCGSRYVSANDADGPTTLGSHPWQAYLVNPNGYIGSGVLVDGTHVLTAAHKVFPNRLTAVYMGVHNPSTNLRTAWMRTVIDVKYAPGFVNSTLKNDLAILTLNAPIPLGYRTDVASACLPADSSSSSFINQMCMVAGWGMTAFGANDAPTSPQKQVRVRIVDFDTCRNSMLRPDVLGTNTDLYLDRNELCAGGVENRDACTQDGGAPLTCRQADGKYTIAGLVIWGKGCGRPGVYGVYVDVGKYLSFVRSNIG